MLASRERACYPRRVITYHISIVCGVYVVHADLSKSTEMETRVYARRVPMLIISTSACRGSSRARRAAHSPLTRVATMGVLVKPLTLSK